MFPTIDKRKTGIQLVDPLDVKKKVELLEEKRNILLTETMKKSL